MVLSEKKDRMSSCPISLGVGDSWQRLVYNQRKGMDEPDGLGSADK
jgi:hypothetical protein